jgi:predicted nucleotidyltransferase
VTVAEGRAGAEAGWAVVRVAAAAARDALGDRLTSVYAIGSLAHGGFGPAVSDVDLALLTEEAIGSEETSRIAASTEAELRTELSRRLSIFHVPWRAFAAPPAGSRFPALDRLDLVRSGVLVGGADVRVATPAPPRMEVVAEAVRFAVERLNSEMTRAVISRPFPGAQGLRETTKLVLHPVRLLFVACTGNVGGNDEAVGHYHRVTGASRLEVVDHALGWRRTGSIPDGESAEGLLRSQLLPLHRQVLDLLRATPGLPERRALASLASDFECL